MLVFVEVFNGKGEERIFRCKDFSEGDVLCSYGGEYVEEVISLNFDM